MNERRGSSAIKRLLNLLSERRDPYRTPPTEVFLDLDVARVAADMELARRGAKRGEEKRPAPGSEDFDDIEYQVIERIEGHKQAAHSIYLEQLRTYDQRLTALNFDERIADLQSLSQEAVGDFRAEAAKGRDELFAIRRQVLECEAERDDFKKRHILIRPARVPTSGKILLKIGILAILFVVEVTINGAFLAKASDQGLLGGAATALSFAGLNIIVSFFCGLVPIRLINRRAGLLKLLGLISLLVYLGFATILNLVLAHLREMAPSLTEDIGHEVLQKMEHAPIFLHDVNSWIFFSIGFVFSIGAMSDGLLFSDPVLGYAGVERRSRDAHRDFYETKSALIEHLRGFKEEVSEAMAQAARSVTVRRGEYDSIVQGRSGLSRRFSEHQNHIERACRALLTIYREANRTARQQADEPGYWSDPWTLNRVETVSGDPDRSAQERLRRLIDETQVLLREQITAVQTAFDEAVTSYREIEKIIPESKSGDWKKAA